MTRNILKNGEILRMNANISGILRIRNKMLVYKTFNDDFMAVLMILQ